MHVWKQPKSFASPLASQYIHHTCKTATVVSNYLFVLWCLWASSMEKPKRIAIVHEWLTSMRGGEKCVEALCELFPQAELFTLLHVKGSVSSTIERMPIHTSFIQNLPFAEQRYRHYLPLFPTAIERFDLTGFDLVISSNHCVAKGVRVPLTALHICYCHTPMRYIWGLYDEYFGKDRASLLTRAGMMLFVGYLRRWDVRTAQNPHHFIANSEHVRQRIKNIYHRTADVIHPPINTSLFQLSQNDDGNFLIVSAFVPYKRVDLAIEAFNRLGERLVVVGDGPDAQRLRSIAQSNIEFVGWQPDEKLKEYYGRCRALIFPGEEDFGMVPVEAMASGKPVIAFAKGGALETVVRTSTLRTGVLFDEQTVDSLAAAVKRFRKEEVTPETLRSFAVKFDREVYKHRIGDYIERKWVEFQSNPAKR
jgi:glycosyltransferase involved in cell wall biosynthesis